jgi:uncharacterized lipoprotein YddW (UPF0748 family)
LKALGINRVYVCVWNNGVLTYRSQYYESFTGMTSNKDTLQYYVQSGRALGIQVFAWFEYGLMSKYNQYDGAFAKVAKAKGLEVGSALGFTWMHPLKSVPFLAGIMIDALRYGVNGVQLDDHFCYPPSLPGSSAQVLTQAAQQVVAAVRAAVPKAYISLSPSPSHHHIKTCNARWLDWAKMGLFDEYAPQMYHYQASAVIGEVTSTLKVLASSPKRPFIVGWAIDHAGKNISPAEATKLVKWMKSKNLGFSVWYAKGVLETYPNLKSVW